MNLKTYIYNVYLNGLGGEPIVFNSKKDLFKYLELLIPSIEKITIETVEE